MWLECTERIKDTGRDLLEMVFCLGDFSSKEIIPKGLYGFLIQGI